MNQKEYIEKKIEGFEFLFPELEQVQCPDNTPSLFLKQTITELTDLIEEETMIHMVHGTVVWDKQKELFKIFRGNEKE